MFLIRVLTSALLSILLFSAILFSIRSVSGEMENNEFPPATRDSSVILPFEDEDTKIASECINLKIEKNSSDFSECVDKKDLNTIYEREVDTAHNKKTKVNIFTSLFYRQIVSFLDFSYSLLFATVFSAVVFILIYIASLVCFISFLQPAGALKKNLLHFSNWTIDAPPMLGIIGTLFAMTSYFSSRAQEEGLSFDGFFDNFILAAATTIVGGIVSVINHFLTTYASINK